MSPTLFQPPTDHRARQPRGSRSRALAGLARLAVLSLAAAGLTACSGDDERPLLSDLNERDRLAVEVATSEQVNLGRQIDSVSQFDNAYELCFEICRRSKDSCQLSRKICDIGVKYPKSAEVAGRCDVSRERCRTHRTKVPRVCTCPE